MLALGHGRPLIVPCLAGLAQLPDDAVLRYDGSAEGLLKSIMYLSEVGESTLEAMSVAAFKFVSGVTWPEIAEATMSEMNSLIRG